MWRERMLTTLLWIVSFLAGFIVATGPILAHGEATLTVTPDTVAPGGRITVTADGVEPGETFTIALQGVVYNTTLGTVSVKEGDSFEAQFTVPEDVPTGFYQVQATNAEGEKLTAELTVEAGATPAQSAESPKPSAAPMQLDRRKTTTEWVGILSLLLASAALGIAMIRTGDVFSK